MNEINLSTPSLLFSAISLILLAYTNRFLSYASIVRSLKEKHERDPQAEPTSLAQLRNLYRRLKLIRAMQILGASSLLFCLTAMFFFYIHLPVLGDMIFGAGMVLLAASLCVCIWEIQISVDALSLNLGSLKKEQPSLLRRRPDDEELQREKSKQNKKKKKSSGEGKSQDERPAREERPERQPREGREERPERQSREGRDAQRSGREERQERQQREPREAREEREPRQSREGREGREEP